MRGRTWLKPLLAAALALAGATTAWAAVDRESASGPIRGVRPVWSPDGKQIAFADLTGTTTTGAWGIFVINADGSGRRQVAGGSTYAPRGISWSPDGKSIAYDAFVGDGPTAAYTVAAAGGKATEVTGGWSPAWGPGNTLLVTDSTVSSHGLDVRLYAVKTDGSDRHVFVECPEVQVGQPCGDGDAAWSPDGKKIAFDTNLFGAAYAVWVMNADGTGRRQLSRFSPPATSPQWARDGSALVYQRHDLDNATNDDIAIVNMDGSGGRVVTRNARNPSWSLDGSAIVFSRNEGATSTLYLVNADGSNVRTLVGSSSTVTVTTPAAAKCVVPNVVGKMLPAAKTLLTKANCKAGTVTQARSTTVAKGRVIATKPKAGTSTARGAAVALTVSRGT